MLSLLLLLLLLVVVAESQREAPRSQKGSFLLAKQCQCRRGAGQQVRRPRAGARVR